MRCDILGSKVNVIKTDEALNNIEDLLNRQSSSYICFSNVHTIVTGRQNLKFRDITNNASIVFPDGMPLVWLCKFNGYCDLEKCSGPDLMEKIFEVSEKKGYTHYLYGSTQETLRLLYNNLKCKYKTLKIVGMFSPPFRPLTEEEDKMLLDSINKLDPDFIWVGLGAPKQEIWMMEHVNKIKSSVLIGVGAAFNFHSGLVKRAPLWMQNIGLEWLYRLMQEPRRLWKRYLITNALFIYYILSDLLLNKFKNPKENT